MRVEILAQHRQNLRHQLEYWTNFNNRESEYYCYKEENCDANGIEFLINGEIYKR